MSPEVWKRFSATVGRWQTYGMGRFEKELRSFAEREGLDWFPADDKDRLHRWALILMRASGSFNYARMRRDQLQRPIFAVWTYHCDVDGPCARQHGGFDRLSLPADHSFWSRHMPPNSWECTCEISGARTLEDAIQRGGETERILPNDWQSSLAIHPHFDENVIPDLHRTVELLRSGYFD